MGSLTQEVADLIGNAIEGVIDFVELEWDEVTVPILEDIFGLFNVDDEVIVETKKVSILLYEDKYEDVLQTANERAVMTMVEQGGSFFPWWLMYTRETREQTRSYYNYAETNRYIYGLPDMQVHGGNSNYAAIDAALNDSLGFSATRLSAVTMYPTDEVYFKNELQLAPYNYRPWENALTYTDQYGVSWDDFRFISVTYNIGPNNYDILVSRLAKQALFWIEGPVHIVEGDSATYTIYSNRAVPAGESVLINLNYSGTAPGSDYTPVPTVIMTAGNTQVNAVVTTNENITVDGNRTIIVTLDSVINTGAAFESVGIHTVDQVITTITDDDGIILTMPSVVATEASGSAIIPVKLEAAVIGPITVNYDFNNGTAIGGIDFDNTPGILTFVGTAGEIQNITVPINSDSPDDNEDFTVYFTSSSFPLLDISSTANVLITDGSDITPIPGTSNEEGTIVKPGYVSERSLIVTYHADVDPATEWFYWIYVLSDETYPDIESNMTVISNMEMMPIAILRKDKINVNANKTTEEYKTTKRLLNFLNLDIDELTSNLEENPGIAEIDEAFINFSVCPSTNHYLISKMLWFNFDYIINVHSISGNANKYFGSFEEQTIKSAVAWVNQTFTSGNSGILANGKEYEHEMIFISKEVDEYGNTITNESANLHIRKQTGPGIYDEIIVSGLNGMASIIYAGYGKMAVNRLGDEDFTIPVSYYMLHQLDPVEQMIIHQFILRLDIYAIQILELEWYQTQSFARLLEWVSVVLFIWSLGTSTTAYTALLKILGSYIISEIVIFIAEETGNAELAAIVGLVVMIALGSQGGMNFDFATAEGLINASTEFANNLTLAYGVEYKDLIDDLNDLNAKAEKRLEEIESDTPEESSITPEFIVALRSVDTTAFPAVEAQYNFDLLYNYDRLIANYHDIHLQTGVV